MAMTKTKVRIIRYTLYGLLILGLTALLGYVLVLRPLQIRQQKQNFTKAESRLDELAKQIEATIGKPDATKKDKSCGRANLLSEKGPLGCDVSIYLLYENKTADISSALMQKVALFSDSNLRIGSGSAHGKSFVNKSQQRGEQTFFQNFGATSQLPCSFSYSYPLMDRKIFIPKAEENLQIGLSCGGPAMAEYYPVNK